MSTIHAISSSKQEFLHNIKNGINTKSVLQFIKKYTKYKVYLNFLPNVLLHIIMSYINDIIQCEYETIYAHNLLVCSIKLNYLLNHYDTEFSFGVINYDNRFLFNESKSLKVTMGNYVIHNNKILYAYSDYLYLILMRFNTFMLKYYNNKLYLPDYALAPFDINNEIDCKSLKYDIIIIKKILSYLQKIENM